MRRRSGRLLAGRGFFAGQAGLALAAADVAQGLIERAVIAEIGVADDGFDDLVGEGEALAVFLVTLIDGGGEIAFQFRDALAEIEGGLDGGGELGQGLLGKRRRLGVGLPGFDDAGEFFFDVFG